MYVNIKKDEIRFPELDYPAIGSRISYCRKRQHFSETEMAEFLSVCRDHYHRLELGQRCPTLETLNAISEILDISLDYLVKGETGQNDARALISNALKLQEHACNLLSEIIIKNML